ncbi:hypothetical protein PF010_g15812 [Phytophthora fragariae]|uniref:Uncharacterized protein n=1 Tax=Phytophthora fragariae TaxID=53985 RepID=A0A6A3YB79_9STRA|nr:hypothetical protein PF010_g15812 [Phytophthora fragariae]KAE9215418.1 hypothetical protein PF002_g17374 [Phytophthora fragariae]KAE9329003.1 hypothetical protein PF008_g16043 [Phytophthora fragariae]
MDHVFVKQGLLDSLGFVYGKAKVRTGRSLNVRVRRIASGRWEALPAFSASLPRAPLQHRIVSEQEALSGIGTFESCVCVPHVGDHSTRTWSYGVVVGYEWKTEAPSSLLHVDFGDKTDAVLFDSSVLQDIAMATYALRPCNSRLVADVMPGEMREIKKVAYDTFMGVNGMATRDSTRIRGSVQAGPLDETQRVPLYEFTAGRVVLLQIQHILDFGFYQDGNRSVPSGMHLGSTIFDYEPPALHVELTLPSQEEVPGNPATASPAIPRFEPDSTAAEAAPHATTRMTLIATSTPRLISQYPVGIPATIQAPNVAVMLVQELQVSRRGERAPALLS